MLDTHSLEILREVARTGSLTQAADKLCLTQSAISHAIRRFEDRYGVKLWEKEGRGIRLTQPGEYLVTLANRILPQLSHAETIIEEFSSGQRGALRVGMECHPCQQWLMGVVTPYLEAWPQIDLDVSTAFQFGGLSALLGHEIDLLITPDPLNRPGLRYCPVFDYELVLVVRNDHPLAQKPYASPEDLEREVLITYPVAPERLDIFTRFLIPAGRGVSAMPDWVVDDYSGPANLHTVRIGQKGIQKNIHIGLRETDMGTGYIDGFLQIADTSVVKT